ncbi:POK7 protein, partial [Anhinga anhinga]|nr:POK7 protein [Anhinga anhinga]
DIIIVDLKDCFFTIPLHPDDAPKFAFSIPKVNQAEPMDRYHWTVLPQGMKNSLTMCQAYVAHTIQPVRQCFPRAYLYHYMDDLLLAAPTKEVLEETYQALK